MQVGQGEQTQKCPLSLPLMIKLKHSDSLVVRIPTWKPQTWLANPHRFPSPSLVCYPNLWLTFPILPPSAAPRALPHRWEEPQIFSKQLERSIEEVRKTGASRCRYPSNIPNMYIYTVVCRQEAVRACNSRMLYSSPIQQVLGLKHCLLACCIFHPMQFSTMKCVALASLRPIILHDYHLWVNKK